MKKAHFAVYSTNKFLFYFVLLFKAFKDGSYTNPSGDDFGDGRYGSMEALVAAIILDPEARSSVLDADPTSGMYMHCKQVFYTFKCI